MSSKPSSSLHSNLLRKPTLGGLAGYKSSGITSSSNYKSSVSSSTSSASASNSGSILITDLNRGKQYKRGKLLGKGGFAKVYEVTDTSTGEIWAAKIVDKASLRPKSESAKARAREGKEPRALRKLREEISIHKSLSHKRIVKFLSWFEDSHNVYILLEKCSNKTMMELIRRRSRLSEKEAREYLLQLLEGCEYMHNPKINVIHRDLKLGNLFLDEKMEIKIGDFGLATKLAFPSERKNTICGTPNYIAPEILTSKQGHSFEVDIWSIGVILYTFLVGKPPFETKDVKTTYNRIKSNSYEFPRHVSLSHEARDLVRSLLRSNPKSRLTLADIRRHPFITGVSSSSTSSSSSSLLHHSKTSSTTSSLLRSPLSELKQGPKSSSSMAGSSSAAAYALLAKKNQASAKTQVSASTSAAGPRLPSSHHSQALSRFATSSPSSTSVKTTGSSENLRENALYTLPRLTATTASSTTKTYQSSSTTPSTTQSSTSPSVGASNDDVAKMHAKLAQSIASIQKAGGRLSTGSVAPFSPGPTTPSDLGPNAGANSGKTTHSSPGVGLASIGKTGPNSPSSSLLVLEPPLMVTKWVDYSNKYGLGYQLSDKTVGVYFNDATRIILAPNGSTCEYHPHKKSKEARENAHHNPTAIMHFPLSDFPSELQKKVTLLKFFRNYLRENSKDPESDSKTQHSNSSSSGSSSSMKDNSQVSEISLRLAAKSRNGHTMIHVKKWLMTKHAIIFRYTNRTLQVNFFDHSKVILTADGDQVTFIDKERRLKSYALSTIIQSPTVYEQIINRLKYIKDLLYHLISKSSKEATALAGATESTKATSTTSSTITTSTASSTPKSTHVVDRHLLTAYRANVA